MKTLFECESEIGMCDPDRLDVEFEPEPGDWLIVAQTSAASTGSKGMLRIEQGCFLRSALAAEDVRAQSWLRPEISLEPALDSKSATVKLLQSLHDQFVARVGRELSDRSLILETAVLPPNR